MRAGRAALAAVVLLFLPACLHLPDGGIRAFNHQDGWAAVEYAFKSRGVHILDCAHRIVDRESGHNPYAKNPRTGEAKYKGMWQMHDGFGGTYKVKADWLNRLARYQKHDAVPFDPYVQSFTALQAFDNAGGSFRANWPTTPAGCP